ncbi:unnamed protein product, partial [Meganyctiphanes norvegica]
MEYDNEECILPDESDYPQNILQKLFVKEEIEVKEEPIDTKSVEINCVKRKLTHTEEKSYQCTICDKKFSQNCHLIKHEMVHTGKKPYQCCKAITCKSSLVIHLRTHTGEKPYQCSQ